MLWYADHQVHSQRNPGLGTQSSNPAGCSSEVTVICNNQSFLHTSTPALWNVADVSLAGFVRGEKKESVEHQIVKSFCGPPLCGDVAVGNIVMCSSASV